MKRSLAVILFTLSIMLAAAALTHSTASAAGSYYKTITINPGQVPSTQTSFPLLISLSGDSDLISHANPSGSDIYFTASTGTTQYPYEIEKYESSTGTLVAWVKVPSLSDSTSLKIWYGGSGGGSNNPTNTWDSSFKGVWHMSQVNALDSTSNHNNGTAVNGTVSSASGQIDGADSFINSPASGYIDCGASGSLGFSVSGTYTWSAWVNTLGAPGGGCGIIGRATKGVSGYAQ